MKRTSLLLCLLSFVASIYSSSIFEKDKFREDVIAKSARSLKCNRAVFLLAKQIKSAGSPLYEKTFQAFIEETVDFCEIVCDGATKYHKTKVGIHDMQIGLAKLRMRSPSPISRKYVEEVSSYFK